MATFNGTSLRVFKDGALIGGEDDCTISFSHEPRDANTKDSGRWNASEEGPLSAELSGGGFVPADAEDVLDVLYDALVGTTVTAIVVGTKSGAAVDTTKHRWIGTFRVTAFDDNGPHRAGRKYSYTMQSTGPVESWNPGS
jgi:hypothetical protein